MNDPKKSLSEANHDTKQESRRRFIKGGGMMLAGGAIAGSQVSVARGAHAYGTDTMKIGLVGCGGRGTKAAMQALSTSGGEVKLVALADVFDNNAQTTYRGIKGNHKDQVDCADRIFVGLDAFDKVMQSDADVVILATPPGFRPQHFEAAIDAGKHVFMEKPVATDAPGVRRILAANEKAKEKGLAVQVGLQRHHEFRYRECIDRLQNGAIGDFILARAYWNGAGVWVRPRKPEMSELEYQMRNWYYFTWLGGDHIDEQHIHNLDVINWLMDGPPVECQGQGGREVRNGIDHGQIYDHHMVEFTYGDTNYGNGMKMLSQCRHIRGCWNSVSEHVHGTKGYCDISKARIYKPNGDLAWESDATEISEKGWQQEHHDLFSALRRGEVPNEGEYGAYSTMTAIMGRMATYSGKPVKWDDALNSEIQLADTDSMTSFDSAAPMQPDEKGRYEVAVPGQTKTV
ncbi:Inositol 2-dehydrogenase [Crateriforma conspicua]|uniref:Inositol 2-dehydrogenase n=1 Tax=Crateriforma conspicua TaxID=2527996 RepID=A0A5C6FR49_9PLAN|nr:Gfo/Idh/MocA family oxidoreductase [Crateriforma conspicua]TWU62963.1 Inositol 2-dehydrogenase [Crateriforma conspicua]